MSDAVLKGWMMEEEESNFRVRVDKVFGSLTNNPSSSAASERSLWSLTDDEVEKKEWNRVSVVDREDNPTFSSFGFLENDEDLRSSIGLDTTLDNEEEEDENDQIALGKEDAGDRLYMKAITDYGSYLNSHNVLPESFQDHAGDSRANIYAAKVRLKEDGNAPASFESLENTGKKVPVVVDSSPTAGGGNLKSILKRKENQADTLQKRVRFDPTCKESSEEELEGTQPSLMSSMETDTGAEDACTRAVPDYVQNPCEYTRYTFDSESEVDDSSNSKAYMDFLNTRKSRMSAVSPPKSVSFIPKKKTAADNTRKKEISRGKANQEDTWKEYMCKPPGILAAEVEENEICAMEEDNPNFLAESKSGSSGKIGRRYRSKVQADDSTEDVVS